MAITMTTTVRPWKMTTKLSMKSRSQLKKTKVKTLTKTSKSKFTDLVQLFRDYEARPELDRYEVDGIDDEEQAILDIEARR